MVKQEHCLVFKTYTAMASTKSTSKSWECTSRQFDGYDPTFLATLLVGSILEVDRVGEQGQQRGDAR